MRWQKWLGKYCEHRHHIGAISWYFELISELEIIF